MDVRREWFLGAAMMLVIFASAFYSRYFLGNNEMVLAAARPYFGLLGLALCCQLIRDGMPWQRIDQLLVACGLIISLIVIVQLGTGIRILDARVEDLGMSATTGVTRSITGVGTLAQAYAIYRFAQCAVDRAMQLNFRIAMAIMLFAAIVGLLGTFTRGAWVATALGALVAAYISNGWRGFIKVISAGSVVLALSFTVLFLVKPVIATAMVDRMLSVADEVESGASFGWRKQENVTALGFISAHPIMGAGLGGAYKGSWNGPGSFPRNEYFIHNGYLSFPLFMGVLGGLLLLYLLLRILQSILISWKSATSDVSSSAVGVFAVALISNIASPVFGGFAGLLFLISLIAVVQVANKKPVVVQITRGLL